jgi:hypothetical protein
MSTGLTSLTQARASGKSDRLLFTPFRVSGQPPKAFSVEGRKYFKNVIAQRVGPLVEICLQGGTKIFIDVATQL